MKDFEARTNDFDPRGKGENTAGFGEKGCLLDIGLKQGRMDIRREESDGQRRESCTGAYVEELSRFDSCSPASEERLTQMA